MITNSSILQCISDTANSDNANLVDNEKLSGTELC